MNLKRITFILGLFLILFIGELWMHYYNVNKEILINYKETIKKEDKIENISEEKDVKNQDKNINNKDVSNNNNNIVEENEDEKVILTLQEIQEYNKKIKERTNTLYNIDNIINLTKEDIIELITSYNLPNLPKYDGDIEYNSNNIDNILNNRNLDNIDLNLAKGIVVKRTNLKSFPTNVSFYDKKNIKDFDRLQETELLVNTPILIIHQSLDNLWYFVISPIYYGWVLQSDIAYTTEADYNYFIKTNSFGIITKPSLNVNNTILDMSVKLPLVKVNKDSLILMMPIKGNIGYVERKEITINIDDVSLAIYLILKKMFINLQMLILILYIVGVAKTLVLIVLVLLAIYIGHLVLFFQEIRQVKILVLGELLI